MHVKNPLFQMTGQRPFIGNHNQAKNVPIVIVLTSLPYTAALYCMT